MSVPPAVAGGYCVCDSPDNEDITRPLPQAVLTRQIHSFDRSDPELITPIFPNIFQPRACRVPFQKPMPDQRALLISLLTALSLQ